METATLIPTLTFNYLPKAHSNGSWRKGNQKSLDWIQDRRETTNSTNHAEGVEQKIEVPNPPPTQLERESEKKTVPLKRAKKLERRIDRLERDVLLLRNQKSELNDKYGVLMATNQELNESLRQEQEKHRALQREMQFLVRKLSSVQDQAMLFKRQVEKGAVILGDLKSENFELHKRVKELELNRDSVRAYQDETNPQSVNGSGMPLQEFGDEKTWLPDEDGLGVTEASRIEHLNPVVLEELGVIWDSSEGLKFRGINNPHVEWDVSLSSTQGIFPGDAVRLVQWADGTRELRRLEVRSRTLTNPKFIAKGSFGSLSSKSSASRRELADRVVAVGNLVIVGGDCPIRYMEALRPFAVKVEWHDGFDKKRELERLLRHADCVITIETQMSHWAMHYVKKLAKQGSFIWRHVKVKSQSTIVNTVLTALRDQTTLSESECRVAHS